MNLYDHSDFLRNPGKYELFATARIARHMFTENGERDLPEGECVGVKYRLTARNQLYRRDEPVFTVSHNGQMWGDVYANALCDFIL